MRRWYIVLMISACLQLQAQTERPGHINPEDRTVDMDNPTFEPMLKVGKVLIGGDSIQYTCTPCQCLRMNKTVRLTTAWYTI